MRVVKDADIRKAEILDAAEKLFNEKGYSKATTEDIFEMTGIARGTLYYHFKSRLHEKENSELHQKSFQQSLLRYTPVMTEIVEQGIKSSEFSTPYPKESVELLLCASQLHDPGVFQWSQEERAQKKKAFFWMLEITLGIAPDAKEKLYRLAGLSQEVV
ncbi:MAG: TetR/AcrR family transcriptional regulator [Lachnospiraceae bacterium]|nr:TetR/AcrR family transcriptional regulator [Lachnospiraceae bacterium]